MDVTNITGHYTSCPAVFWEYSKKDDDHCMLCAIGSVIQLLSCTTGNLIGTFNGHNAIVTNIVSLIANSSDMQSEYNRTKKSSMTVHVPVSDVIVSSSIDGIVVFWNIKTLEEMGRLHIDAPVYEIIPHCRSHKCSIVDNHINTVTTSSAKKSKKQHKHKHSDNDINDNSNDNNSSSDEKYTMRYNEIYLVIGGSLNHTNGISKPINEKKNESSNGCSKKKKKKKVDEMDDKYKLVMYDMNASKIRRKVTTLKGSSSMVGHITYDGEEYLVIANKSKLSFWSIESKDKVGKTMMSQYGTITCVTVSKGNVFAGHEGGEIVMWYNVTAAIRNADAEIVSTMMHWHAHPVNSLTISADGLYLFSGGEEGVLVVWQLSSGSKSFLPRLGSSIASVRACHTQPLVAVSSHDNSLHLINIASMKEGWVVKSLCMKSEHKKNSSVIQSDMSYRLKLQVEQRTGNIVCNGYPGQLQCYDPVNSCFSSSYQILQYTRVSKKESYTKMYLPSTVHYDFIYLSSQLSSYMITVDVRRGENSDRDISLKFWYYDSIKHKYVLNTQIDQPHADNRITTAMFLPLSSDSQTISCLQAVTSAVDGSIKVWKTSPMSGAEKSHNKMKWICSYSFRNRENPVNALSFSADSSVMAIAQENVVYLCDVSSTAITASIVAPTPNNIIFVAFIEAKLSRESGNGHGEALLVVGSKRSLSVYNLMTLKLIWSIEGRFSSFATAKTDKQCVAVNGNDVWIAAVTTKNKKSYSNTTTDGDGDGDGDDTDADDSDTDGDDSQDEIVAKEANSNQCKKLYSDDSHKVFLFNPHLSTPVYIKSFPSRLQSVLFANKDILIACASGEVVSLSPPPPASDTNTVASHTSRSMNAYALMSEKVGRVKPLLMDGVVEKKVSSDGNSNGDSSIGFKRTNAFVFDEVSENIPPISLLFDGFMNNLLKLNGHTTDSSSSSSSSSSVPSGIPMKSVTDTASTESVTACDNDATLHSYAGLSSVLTNYFSSPSSSDTAYKSENAEQSKASVVTPTIAQVQKKALKSPTPTAAAAGVTMAKKKSTVASTEKVKKVSIHEESNVVQIISPTKTRRSNRNK